MLEWFKKLGPPNFKGVGTDTLWPARWIQELEKNFTALGCTDQQKVFCATFMLQDGAHSWWMAHKQILEAVDPIITWVRFVGAFYKSYFPNSVKVAKEAEFLQLTQGLDTVMTYKKKFEDLSMFAPEQVDTEEKKVRRFLGGINTVLRGPISIFNLTSYAELIEKALTLEENWKGNIIDTSGKGKRPLEFQAAKNTQPHKFVKTQDTPRTQEAPAELEPCRICGRSHGGPCRYAGIICYSCGQKGHHSKVYPTPRQFPAPTRSHQTSPQG
ncbi:uncharacterized protein LOC122655127 [Telopea speciosissima]|uniref:uncharacterized protein LOC122655127 n=1 Tax=Telopea speciosissima TaxID=54955 RepID=UPI001CC476AD|nr:uncharacterized protein LOC122655127 [Telopea speciosissima]